MNTMRGDMMASFEFILSNPEKERTLFPETRSPRWRFRYKAITRPHAKPAGALSKVCHQSRHLGEA